MKVKEIELTSKYLHTFYVHLFYGGAEKGEGLAYSFMQL